MTPRPRQSASLGSNTCSSRRCATTLPSGRTARVYWMSIRGSRQAHEHEQRLQHVARLEPGDHAGDAVVAREELVAGRPGDHAHVPGQQEPADGRLAQVEQRAQRQRHGLVQAEEAEVGEAGGARLEQRRRRGRRGGLEADAGEDDLPVRLGGGDAHGVAAASRRRARRRRRRAPRPACRATPARG